MISKSIRVELSDPVSEFGTESGFAAASESDEASVPGSASVSSASRFSSSVLSAADSIVVSGSVDAGSPELEHAVRINELVRNRTRNLAERVTGIVMICSLSDRYTMYQLGCFCVGGFTKLLTTRIYWRVSYG